MEKVSKLFWAQSSWGTVKNGVMVEVWKANPVLAQYLTAPGSHIGKVQLGLLNAELVSDKYTVQSSL